MSGYEIPKFEIPTFYDKPKPAQTSAATSDSKEKKSAKKTINAAGTKGSKVDKPVNASDKQAALDELDKYYNEETQTLYYPQPEDLIDAMDIDDDGQVDSWEAEIYKETIKEEDVKTIQIAEEKSKVIHEEDVEGEEIITNGQNVFVFRDNDETTADKKIDNTNADKENGDTVIVVDGSENAETTIEMFGTDFFYVPITSNEEKEEVKEEKLNFNLKEANYVFLDDNQIKLNKLSSLISEKLDSLLEVFFKANKIDKDELSLDTIRDYKVKLLNTKMNV